MQQNTPIYGEMNMKPGANTRSNDLLIKRLHEMRMSASDIASAEASLRHADAIVDFGFGVVAAIRSLAAYVARHFRAVFVSTPHH
jgi:hypothetical protein